MQAEERKQAGITAIENIIASYAENVYRIQVASVQRVGGYSNQNYRVVSVDNRHYIARLARRNRTEESCVAEEYLLRSLAKQRPQLAPVLVRLPSGSALVDIAGNECWQYLHLFHAIPGTIDGLWWQQCSIDKLEQLFEQLAVLHQQMNGIMPLTIWEPVMRRYPLPETAPAVLAATATGSYVIHEWQQFLQGATQIQQDMEAVFPWHKARYQWIHGDVQMENVLFNEGGLTSFLDFEWVSWDACEKDVILSAFRTCKEGRQDDFFRYDDTRLQVALDAYRRENPDLCEEFFTAFDTLWKPFFCLDQAMLYLVNAFDGIWELQPGIGFLPCFDEVVQYRSPL
ncbi:Ser/Thr protein kinase RdoA involved in Cpx stress response, MazF antagonist [Filimonas lacunae]|uniref:Ser/Thr protein kinase RdoA involved in Cpx stress response, MazF antagonist n=1 Tax=Filimonas lacunae TaxID=477680 RepID=A0A173MM13_9BACT|nr:phosphotransferase [Filimonas lacunae]BAV08672.1 aminoglycoside phosphotransferase [Filimonas lacunae]SIS59723.1 Ser/Thr protein kinase RdoA involved in Cpx stress response, MazF antagonist [Filimonas lacunae]